MYVAVIFPINYLRVARLGSFVVLQRCTGNVISAENFCFLWVLRINHLVRYTACIFLINGSQFRTDTLQMAVMIFNIQLLNHEVYDAFH